MTPALERAVVDLLLAIGHHLATRLHMDVGEADQTLIKALVAVERERTPAPTHEVNAFGACEAGTIEPLVHGVNCPTVPYALVFDGGAVSTTGKKVVVLAGETYCGRCHERLPEGK